MTTQDSIKTLKSQHRDRILRRRQGLGLIERDLAANQLVERLSSIPILCKSRHIAIYFPHKGELDPQLLRAHPLFQNKQFYLPRIEDGVMAFAFWVDRESLESGDFKILTPKKQIPSVELEIIECILVPGLAFDLQGNRLGWGKGYYDQVLQDFQGVSMGLAYDFQVIEQVPCESHDVKLDWLVTPTRTVEIPQS